jgi:membrane protease YdiL (CAAX protease family)
MNKKLIRDFIIITFILQIIFWGGASLICKLTSLTIKHILIKVLYYIGLYSPTIASFISLKRNKVIENILDFIEPIFRFKQKIKVFIIILLFLASYFYIGCMLNTYEKGLPYYSIFLNTLIFFVRGGNEELGWRMLLQPELEKRLKFFPAAIITGLITWLWNTPLFFITGIETMNYLYFGITCLIISISTGIIKRNSKGIFTCMIYRALILSISTIFVFISTLLTTTVTLIAFILLSISFLYAFKKEKDS